MAAPALTDEQFKVVEQAVVQCLETGTSLGALNGYSREEIEATYHLAYNLYQQQRNDQAKTLFKFLTLHEHADTRFWLGLAGACQRLGEFESAVGYYSHLAVIDATNPLHAFRAGECFMAMNDWAQAQKAVEGVTALCEALADEGIDYSELLKRTELMSQVIARRLSED